MSSKVSTTCFLLMGILFAVNATNFLQNVGSQECAYVPGSSQNSNTQLKADNCLIDRPNYNFALKTDGIQIKPGGIYFQWTLPFSGQYLSVLAASTANGAAVVQATANNGDEQWWSYSPVGEQNGRTTLQMKNLKSGKCLTQDGNNLEQNDCSSTNDQIWTLRGCNSCKDNPITVDPQACLSNNETDNYMKNKGNSKCVGNGLLGAATANCDLGAGDQSWSAINPETINSVPYVMIKNTASLKCLDVTLLDLLVVQDDCSPTEDSQKWEIVSSAAGYFYLKNKEHGGCVTVSILSGLLSLSLTCGPDASAPASQLFSGINCY